MPRRTPRSGGLTWSQFPRANWSGANEFERKQFLCEVQAPFRDWCLLGVASNTPVPDVRLRKVRYRKWRGIRFPRPGQSNGPLLCGGNGTDRRGNTSSVGVATDFHEPSPHSVRIFVHLTKCLQIIPPNEFAENCR